MPILTAMLTAAGILLLSATIVLLRFNWNEKIYVPFFTILGVGFATALAAILFGLHETKVESAFVTSAVFDIENKEPAYVEVTEQNYKLAMRLMDLHFLKPFPFRFTSAGPLRHRD